MCDGGEEFACGDVSASEKGGWPDVWPCPCGEFWECGPVWEDPSPSAFTGSRDVETM
jgi:hypothetical protein